MTRVNGVYMGKYTFQYKGRDFKLIQVIYEIKNVRLFRKSESNIETRINIITSEDRGAYFDTLRLTEECYAPRLAVEEFIREHAKDIGPSIEVSIVNDDLDRARAKRLSEGDTEPYVISVDIPKPNEEELIESILDTLTLKEWLQ